VPIKPERLYDMVPARANAGRRVHYLVATWTISNGQQVAKFACGQASYGPAKADGPVDCAVCLLAMARRLARSAK
jgi:hypothetical protein